MWRCCNPIEPTQFNPVPISPTLTLTNLTFLHLSDLIELLYSTFTVSLLSAMQDVRVETVPCLYCSPTFVSTSELYSEVLPYYIPHHSVSVFLARIMCLWWCTCLGCQQVVVGSRVSKFTTNYNIGSPENTEIWNIFVTFLFLMFSLTFVSKILVDFFPECKMIASGMLQAFSKYNGCFRTCWTKGGWHNMSRN